MGEVVKSAIYAPAMTQWVAEARPMVAAITEADAMTVALERKTAESRDIAQARRIELGMYLRKVRGLMPARGTADEGWRAFLDAIEISVSTAHVYMEDAGKVSNRTASMSPAQVERSGAAYEKAPTDDRPAAPPPTDDDVEQEAARTASQAEAVGEPDVEIDRDTWCTPLWLAEAIGEWDIDPCSNDRSHIKARETFDLEKGINGLERAKQIGKLIRLFINPPYSDVMPWIQAYKHTRFCFLLKFDPSTKWFAALMERTELVLFPRGTRIQFEAPAGVPPEKALANQFPHALFYARGDDATDAIKSLCFSPWRTK